jgi:hypothetical protein
VARLFVGNDFSRTDLRTSAVASTWLAQAATPAFALPERTLRSSAAQGQQISDREQHIGGAAAVASWLKARLVMVTTMRIRAGWIQDGNIATWHGLIRGVYKQSCANDVPCFRSPTFSAL